MTVSRTSLLAAIVWTSVSPLSPQKRKLLSSLCYKHSIKMLIRVIVIFILGLELCTACDMDQTKQGCRIQNKACSCGFGCASEYRYDTMAECQNALRGKKRDICNPNPCLHGGSCIQISQNPKYKCRCEGTGYFGLRCNRACPVSGAGAIGDIFPYECIVI